MLSSPAAKKKNSNIEIIWSCINQQKFREAQEHFFHLNEKEKSSPDAQLAVVRIHQGLGEYERALTLVKTLPHKISTKKAHAKILFSLEQYSAALEIFDQIPIDEKKIDPRDIEVLLDKLKCYLKLKQNQNAVKLEQLLAPYMRQTNVAVNLCNMYYDQGETLKAKKIITSIPSYQNNAVLVRTLIYTYIKLKQFDEIIDLYKNVPGFVKANPKFKIDYNKALLKTNNASYKEEAILNLKALLTNNLSSELQKKIITLILTNNLSKDFKNEINNYHAKNPQDKQIALQPSINKAELEALIKDRSQNALELRNYLRNTPTLDKQIALNIYEKLIANDPEQQDIKLWSEYTSFLATIQPQKAIAQFQVLIEKSPTYAYLYIGLSKCYQGVENLATQDKLLRKGLTHCPDNFRILNLLIDNLTTREQYHEALELILTFTQKYPQKTDPKVQLCYAYIRVGFIEQARLLLQEMIAKDPKNPQLIVTYGQCLMQACLFYQARMHFDSYKTHLLYWSQLAQPHAICFEKGGDYQGAFNILVNRCHALKESVDGYIPLLRCLAGAAKLKSPINNAQHYINVALNKFPKNTHVLMSISNYYYFNNQKVLAKEIIERALQEAPNNVHVKNCAYYILHSGNSTKKTTQTLNAKPLLSTNELFHQGIDLLIQEDLTGAQKILKTLYQKAPNERKTFFFGAQYYENRHDFNKAQQQIEKIKKNFGGLTILEALQEANISRSKGEYARAILMLEEILKKAPNDIFTLLKLSDCYLKLNDFQNAILNCHKILAFNPDNLKATILLARIAIEQENFSHATKHIEDAIRINPYDKNTVLVKVNLFKKFEQFVKGIDLLLKIEEFYPNDRCILLELFNLHYIIDNLKKSNIYLEKLKQHHPNHPEVILANIRYKLTTPKQEDFEDIDRLFKKLKNKHPHFQKAYIHYALFVKRRSGHQKAIQIFEDYLKNKLKNYPSAYSELGLLYISTNNFNEAESTYLKGIKENPGAHFLYINYFYFMLFIKKTQDKEYIANFYKNSLKTFKSSHIRNIFAQHLFRAGLLELVEKEPSPETSLIEAMNQLSIASSVQTILKPAISVLKSIQDSGFIAYCIGGAARFKYLREKGENNGLLNDIDIYTNAPIKVLKKIFTESSSCLFIPNKLNYYAMGFKFDINYIGTQIHNLPYFFQSQHVLNIDCLALELKGEKLNNLDPTGKAIFGLSKKILNFIGDIEETCKSNSITLFRMIRHQVTYNCTIAQELIEANIFPKMLASLRNYNSEGKITAEISKILQCGKAYDCFKLMQKQSLLAKINPDLDISLKDNAFFASWFYNQLQITDQIVQSRIIPLKSYVLAVYLLANIFKFQQLHENNMVLLNENLLEDFLYKTFSDRQDHRQVQHYLVQLYFSYLYQLNLCPYNVRLQDEVFSEQPVCEPRVAPTYLPSWQGSKSPSQVPYFQAPSLQEEQTTNNKQQIQKLT